MKDFEEQSMGPGLKKLIEAVQKDCTEGEGCFSMEGCKHQFYKTEITDNPFLKEIGVNEVCKRTSKCTHKYCDKLKWVLDRAQQYTDALGVSRDEVINAWENDRDYWYMNYYQDCNQPPLEGNLKVIKSIDWEAQIIERFGENPDNWKFVCPACGHVQSTADFMEINQDPNLAYSCCIGRYKGVNDKTGKHGCDYTVNGLIHLNKTTVITKWFTPVRVFEMAPAELFDKEEK